MTARAAPYFPKSANPATGDGTNKDFEVGFPFLDPAHLRVFVNGVLKANGTDYVVLDTTSPTRAVVRFAVAPTNTHTVKLTRNTPIERYRGNPAISMTDSLQAQYRMQEALDARQVIDLGAYGQTALLAATPLSWVAAFDGFMEKLITRVEKTVTTGGPITVEIDGVAVTGLSVSVGDGAIVGTVQSDVPTQPQSATTKFKKGQTITVTPDALFATAGDVSVKLEAQPADLT